MERFELVIGRMARSGSICRRRPFACAAVEVLDQARAGTFRTRPLSRGSAPLAEAGGVTAADFSRPLGRCAGQAKRRSSPQWRTRLGADQAFESDVKTKREPLGRAKQSSVPIATSSGKPRLFLIKRG